MGMEVPVKRTREMPKRRWLDNIRNDLSERELSGEEAQGRVKWRRLIRNIDPHIKSGKDVDEEGSYIVRICNKSSLAIACPKPLNILLLENRLNVGAILLQLTTVVQPR